MYAITGGPNILWIIAAIPIIVFLVIYFLCRRKYQDVQMDKMRILDLE
jgi:Flp pilus assembly protein TadB